jgi:hypothetical protein
MATTTSTPQVKEFKSLFDYLGRKAGSDLGLAVACYATRLGEPQGLKRRVDVSTYKGLVSTYRPDFLEFFFAQDTNRTIIDADVKAYQEYKAKKK